MKIKCHILIFHEICVFSLMVFSLTSEINSLQLNAVDTWFWWGYVWSASTF